MSDDHLPLSPDAEGATGGVRATLKLRDHGFEPKRNRKRLRSGPSQETRERTQWLYWLADNHYDFATDDPQDVPAELSFEVWRAKHRLRNLRRKAKDS